MPFIYVHSVEEKYIYIEENFMSSDQIIMVILGAIAQKSFEATQTVIDAKSVITIPPLHAIQRQL